jgi:hypothetical protein
MIKRCQSTRDSRVDCGVAVSLLYEFGDRHPRRGVRVTCYKIHTDGSSWPWMRVPNSGDIYDMTAAPERAPDGIGTRQTRCLARAANRSRIAIVQRRSRETMLARYERLASWRAVSVAVILMRARRDDSRWRSSTRFIDFRRLCELFPRLPHRHHSSLSIVVSLDVRSYRNPSFQLSQCQRSWCLEASSRYRTVEAARHISTSLFTRLSRQRWITGSLGLSSHPARQSRSWRYPARARPTTSRAARTRIYACSNHSAVACADFYALARCS